MRCVLLVDSDDESRDLYGEFLRFLDCEVLACDTAEQARVLARRADAVVTGLRLRGEVGGAELVHALRRDPCTTSLPIVVLSACAFDSDAEKSRAAGCDVFLAKPCLPEDLVAGIQRAAYLRRRWRALEVSRVVHRRRRGHE